MEREFNGEKVITPENAVDEETLESMRKLLDDVMKERSAPAAERPEPGLLEALGEHFARMERKMERRFDAIERRLSQQTGQMEGMKEELKNLREAFDRIMADYFRRIAAMVAEITSLSGGEIEPGEFRARIEALREAIGMLGSDTAALAGPEMRKMYEEEIPALRRSVNKVYDLILTKHDDLQGSMDSLADLISHNTKALVTWVQHSEGNVLKDLRRMEGEIKGSLSRKLEDMKFDLRPLGSRNRFRN